ncbi:TRADD-N-associated membrane domain-containing protein [Desulfobacter postgatei]|jgi:hypothetical protein|uniref:Cyanobacterial TRADD-N associated 2 transmembrane domain-containing protein n=1 Tax=Desulfobacter postgatei 2ac9 TaxID=879212 RepID=I5AYR5_9BACT|nr:hypothetical protein [Desulfobacter postgatei]EIM62378.1 hypothetical protein DespoDRAFT_00349 [Desulfobacter postgatei 2ac9]
MGIELIFTFASGIITAAIAVILNILNERFSRRKQQERKNIEDVLAAVEAKAEEAKAKVIASIAEKAPAGATPIDIAEKLASQFRIGGDVVINQITKEGSDFIQDLVTGYHHQALSQAKVQFWFSIMAATVGFGYILLVAASAGLDQLSSLVKILPGLVIDAVAALFFRQAEQTRQRATDLYDRLRKDSQMSMAQKLLASIEDKKIKSVAQAQIALHMAGLEQKEIDISKLTESP